MTMGLMLIFLTGLAWGGIGVVLGFAARRRLNVLAFLTAAAVLDSIAAWVFLVHWPSLLAGHVQRALPLVLLLSVAGVVGTVGTLSLQKAMTAGAAAWTVGQSAMVVPFAVGVLFLGEPLRIGGGLGLVAILGSLAAFANSRKGPIGETKTPAINWLRYALLALVLLGAQQTLCSIPSSWAAWSDTARLRGPLTLAAGALPLVVISFQRRLWPERAVWVLAPPFAALVIAGQLLIFAAMDRLRLEGRLCLAYPLALGTCIVVVALCDILVWKTPANRFTLAGVVLGLLGVVLLAS